jgi:hypothetical protein
MSIIIYVVWYRRRMALLIQIIFSIWLTSLPASHQGLRSPGRHAMPSNDANIFLSPAASCCCWLANAKDMKGPRRTLLVGQIFERNTHATRWLQEQPSSSCTLHFFFPLRSSQQRNNVLPTYSEI